MTNAQKFQNTLAETYRDLFANDPEYAFSASRTTPEALAEKMTAGLLTGSANKDGDGIKRTCRAVGIKQTYSSIREFLAA
jgi:hypothetical protein